MLDGIFQTALLLCVMGRPWMALFVLVISGKFSLKVRGFK